MAQLQDVKLRSGGALTREQFLLRETRIVARLILDGETPESIVATAAERNIFQYPTTSQSRNIARVCVARLGNLRSPQLVRLMALDEGLHEEAAQCNLYAMARTYRLMRQFLVEEIGVRYRTLNYSFTRMDMNAFFTRLAMEDRTVAKWSDRTVSKLKTVLRSSLAQAGILADAKSEELQKVLLSFPVRDGIAANGDHDLLPAFNCMDAIGYSEEVPLP